MDYFPPWQRRFYTVLGQHYYWTHRLRHRHFLGFTWYGWLVLLFFSLLLGALLLGWGWRGLLSIAAAAALAQAAFWHGQRAGYHKFLPDEHEALPATADLHPLPDEQRVTLWATGVFSLVDREAYVLLRRPSQYWRVPVGDHILMVEQYPQHYLYQMFNAETLQSIRRGWFIFGRQPHRALAITFLVTFGPGLDDPTLRYFVGGGVGSGTALKPRTIYLSFQEEAVYQAVWHTILQDLQVPDTGQNQPE